MSDILGDIEWYRGDSYPLGLRIKNKATKEYVDITNYSFWFTVNTEKDPLDDTNQKFQVIGVVDPDQVANKGRVTFMPTEANTDIDKATYYFDVQMSGPLCPTKTIAKFKFKLHQDLTKI